MCVRVRVRVCARARTHWHTWVTYPYNTYIYVRVDTPGLRIPTIHTCMYVLTHHTWVLDIISSPRFTADCDAADKSNVSVLHNHLFIRGHAGDVRVSWACRGRVRARGGAAPPPPHTHTHTVLHNHLFVGAHVCVSWACARARAGSACWGWLRKCTHSHPRHTHTFTHTPPSARLAVSLYVRTAKHFGKGGELRSLSDLRRQQYPTARQRTAPLGLRACLLSLSSEEVNLVFGASRS